MDLQVICLRCFQYKGEFDVCPYCGYVEGSPPPQAYFLHSGTILHSRYVIGTVLGYGGFGVIYKAYDTNLGVVVAIKEFYPVGLVNRTPGDNTITVFPGDSRQSFDALKTRFLEEARNLAKFNGDKHIVNVYDYFEANSTAYIAMEYLDGQTLKEYLAVLGGKMPKDDMMRVAKSLLEGLTTIHAQGIIHRDISPDNVFLLRDGRIKILDFGAARFTGEDEPAETVRSTIIKVGYAPPEQYHTKTAQGAWTDVYAVGATLYRLVTGQTPDESTDRAARDDLKRPSQTGVNVEPHVDKAIMTALALAPGDRYQSAGEMLDVLQGRARASYPEEKHVRRRVMYAALLLAIAVIVALLAAFVFLDGRQGGRAAAASGWLGSWTRAVASGLSTFCNLS